LRDFIYTDFNANDVLTSGWAQSNHKTIGKLRQHRHHPQCQPALLLHRL
jgi:hypothetical protein